MTEGQPTAQQPQESMGETEQQLVVFAPRISKVLKNEIDAVRGITDQTVNEVGNEALQDWVAKKLSDEEVRAKAESELDAAERELKERRANLGKILGRTASTSSDPTLAESPTPKGRQSRKNPAAS